MYDFGIRNALSGYRPAYRTGTACPGCGGSHWTIGRFSAECAFCCTALPLAPIAAEPAKPSYPAWSERL